MDLFQLLIELTPKFGDNDGNFRKRFTRSERHLYEF